MKTYILLPVFVVLLALGTGTLAHAQSDNANVRAQQNVPVCPGPANKGDARCHAHVITDANGAPKASIVPAGYGPVQFHTAYNLPLNAAVGTPTIAIVDAYDDPNIEKDLAIYSKQYGLPSCTTANGCFKKVNQTGGTSYPQASAGWALEIALDVEVAHATCQNCKILLVEASSNSFTNLLAAEDYATAHASVVSNSWGAREFSSETFYDSHFNKPGVAITVSSGDNGYEVDYPAASQYVTAVGGTTLKLNGDNSRASETVWSGSGSGCSTFENKPAWQTDTNCTGRTVADVSAVADPSTGAAVYDSVKYFGRTGWFVIGGTSLSSPLIAGVYALSGNTGSSTNPANSLPYVDYAQNAFAHLYDILSGSNGSCGTYLCNAQVGYDGPTGLGTPNGTGAF